MKPKDSTTAAPPVLGLADIYGPARNLTDRAAAEAFLAERIKACQAHERVGAKDARELELFRIRHYAEMWMTETDRLRVLTLFAPEAPTTSNPK